MASSVDRAMRGGKRQRRVASGLASALILLIGASCGAHAAMPSAQPLASGWQVRLAPGDARAAQHPAAARWLPASVPGTVQTDLMAAGLVADPFIGTNEAAIQWVGLSDWDEATTFDVDAATLRRRHVELVFDGLDTFADVEVDGHPVLKADNMFRRWRVPVRALLHPGANRVTVHLYSPIARIQPWLAKQPHALPGEFDSAFGDEPVGRQSANYVRKAAYQYGWDWGPRIVTLGLWQGVRVEAWDTHRVAGMHVAQDQVSADVARVRAQFDVQSDVAGPVHLALDVLDPQGHAVARIERDEMLAAGDNTLDLPLAITHPQRWFPVGYGDPSLYTFKATLRDGDGAFYDGSVQTGLRSVELRRENDVWGRSFAFVVNGIPIFAKGADLVPFDSFPSRVTAAQMRHVLESARDANMNMVRVWGGGYYLPDDFYAMADRMGLMVWQEFMFGGAVPPRGEGFVDNVRQEAIEQVDRLRDHPSIVLWCGNNEVETGWESWDDRQAFAASLAPAGRDRIVAGMTHLFDGVLRDVVAHGSPGVPYWPSSPSSDYDGDANLLGDGDYHYWDVWSGKAAPVETYLTATPRFESEYGLQSFPSMRTLAAFAGPDVAALSPELPVLRAHQKYDKGNGNARLLLYIQRQFGTPANLADFVYFSQLMQAEGIALNAEHLRASRPQAMGSLYWQLNDAWPGASWSSIDYDGRWKALQFHARRFYASELIAALRRDGTTGAWLVSDDTVPRRAHWQMRLMDFAGNVTATREGTARLPALSSTRIGDWTDAQLLAGADPRSHVAVFEWLDGEATVSRQLVFFGAVKNLALPLPHIDAQLVPAAGGATLTLRSDRLAREVWVSFGALDAQLSDNAFDLLPGQTVRVQVRSAADVDALRKALSIRDVAHAMADAAPAAAAHQATSD